MEREVVIRFTSPADAATSRGGAAAAEQVRGTVAAAGYSPRPFTGWLQLLGHLEVLSGVHRTDASGE